jgi:hypothetical protein
LHVLQTFVSLQVWQPVMLQRMQFPFVNEYPVKHFEQTFGVEQELHPTRAVRLQRMHLLLVGAYPAQQRAQTFGTLQVSQFTTLQFATHLPFFEV